MFYNWHVIILGWELLWWASKLVKTYFALFKNILLLFVNIKAQLLLLPGAILMFFSIMEAHNCV